jgi:hypothetical protein
MHGITHREIDPAQSSGTEELSDRISGHVWPLPDHGQTPLALAELPFIIDSLFSATTISMLSVTISNTAPTRFDGCDSCMTLACNIQLDLVEYLRNYVSRSSNFSILVGPDKIRYYSQEDCTCTPRMIVSKS